MNPGGRLSQGQPYKDEWSDLTERIIGSAIAVHTALGPGYLESIYHKALVLDLRAKGYHTSNEVEVPIHYLGVLLGKHRLDMVVAGRAVVELKAVRKLDGTHFAQVRSYLAASSLPVGMLINFANPKVECRRVYPPSERAKLMGSRASRAPGPDHVGDSDAPPPIAGMQVQHS